jgi:hypothetical protein
MRHCKVQEFYSDEDNKDKLWFTGASKVKLTETPLPHLLALLTFVTEFLGKQGGHVSHTNCRNLRKRLRTVAVTRWVEDFISKTTLHHSRDIAASSTPPQHPNHMGHVSTHA